MLSQAAIIWLQASAIWLQMYIVHVLLDFQPLNKPSLPVTAYRTMNQNVIALR